MIPSFGGREARLSTLHERLERARKGKGGLVLVTGETGVGKTRLVEELEHGAADVESLFVKCLATAGAPDLWPFSQALRSLRSAEEPLAPELDALADARLPASTLTDPQARFALFDGCVRAFATSAKRRPLLLAIDDLELADAHTLGLIALLSPQLRALPMLVVATHGKRPARLPLFRAAVAALAKESNTTSVRLEPLSRVEVASVMEQALGRAPTEALLDKVFDKSQGNPLLLSQLVQVLDGRLDGSDVATSALVGGETMRDVIGGLLSTLPESARRALTVASVFGRVFPLAPLAAALGATNEAVLRELDAADVARVVARSGDAGYRFTYPLVRDVLYRRLPRAERARLHTQVATALWEQLGSSRDHQRVGEIAFHLVEASVAGDVNSAVDASLRAAELARAAGDEAAAMKYAERGIEAFMFAQRPDETRRALLEERCVAIFNEAPSAPESPSEPSAESIRAGLSPRQRETLDGLLRGLSEKEVAHQLGVSPHTVHVYVKALHRAFGVRSRAELLSRWLRSR